MNNSIPNVKELISEINRIHACFSNDYFETGKVQKVNLSRTIANVPLAHIYNYRLNLHESINDYLIKASITIRYFYRVKTRESIDHKIDRYKGGDNQYPVNNWMNDIFGARMILSSGELAEIQDLLDSWQDEFGLKNWYFRDKNDYRGLHIYFKNKSSFFFPWELQLWDENDVELNIKNHQLHKRNFVV